MRQFLSILFILTVFSGFSQTSIKQDLKTLKKTESEQEKKQLILSITDKIINSKYDLKRATKLLSTPISTKPDSLYYAEVIYREGNILNSNGEINSALKKLNKAELLFEKNNENYKVALVKSLKGKVYQKLLNTKKAISSLKYADKILTGTDRIKNLTYLGHAYNQSNELDFSLKHYNNAFQAVEINKEDNFLLFDIYNGISSVYFKTGNYEEFLIFQNKSLTIAQDYNYTQGQVVCLHNIAVHYKKNENYEKAKYYFVKAISLFKDLKNESLKAQLYFKYAQVELNLKDIKKATKYIQLSENIYNKLNQTAHIPAVLNVKAEIEKAKGNLTEAIAILEDASEKAKKTNAFGAKSLIYFNLATAYKDNNEAEKSYNSYTDYVVIEDSIWRINKNKELESVRVKFEVNKIENDLELLEEKKKASNYRNILLAFVIIGLIFFVYRQRKISKVQKEHLEQKKKVSELSEKLHKKEQE